MRRHLCIFGVLVVSSAVVGCGKHKSATPVEVTRPRLCINHTAEADGYCWVSMVSVLANPHDYDGKVVMLSGYVHFEFEDSGVYLDKESYEHSQLANGLALLADDATASGCQDKYALVRGTFTTKLQGQGLMPGGIQNVTVCSPQPVKGR
jgi:hypothetical protein